MKIRLVGERCWVWLNDKVVVDNARLHNFFGGDKGTPLPKTGPIQLQTHGAEIRFKNLIVKAFNTEESNKILAEAEAKLYGDNKFASLFNGKDLAGWAGSTSNYTVVDGAIQCLKGKGGVLHTEKFIRTLSSAWSFNCLLPETMVGNPLSNQRGIRSHARGPTELRWGLYRYVRITGAR